MNAEFLAQQKQEVHQALTETKNALQELENAKESYKIISGIMVSADKETLKKGLEERRNQLSQRMDALQKKEENDGKE